MNIEKHNLHWKGDYFYQFNVQRAMFGKLADNINNRQIIAVTGLRRTGKTVLMKQIINFLLKEQSVKRANVLYYSFDEEQPKIEEIINEFEKTTNVDIKKSKVYVFFDEIQKLENWQNQIKYYYDNFDIKFFVSGSSSLFIKNKAKESLAGRCFDFYLPPLTFREFLVFRGKEELITGKLFQSELKKEFDVYLKRQFIEVINETEEYVQNYVKSIIEKVVYIDIPTIFPIENRDLLLSLLRIIASNPGMIIEYGGLAKELGINRTTLSNYFFYLEEAFLIRKTYNFSRNMLTSEKKSKKFYLNSTSFFSFLNAAVDESKLVENLTAIETNSKFFWRTPFRDEIDFILTDFDDKKILPLEVKYRKTIPNKDLKSIIKFCNKNSLSEAIILTKEEEKTFTKDNIKITFIPLWKWLLEN